MHENRAILQSGQFLLQIRTAMRGIKGWTWKEIFGYDASFRMRAKYVKKDSCANL